VTDRPSAGPRKAGSLERVRRFLEERGLDEGLISFEDRSTKT
jgi:hypothetical protein